MRESLILEFYGFAGVGKTTVCNELYRTLNIKGLNNGKINEEKIPLLYKFNIKVLFYSICFFFKTKPEFSKRSFKNLKSLYLSQIKTIYFKKVKGIHISDQGVFQSIGTMRKHSRIISLFNLWDEKLIKVIAIPDMLIIVEANTAIISKRIYQRDKLILATIKIKQGQERVKKTIEDAKFISKQNNNFRFIVINNSQDNLTKIVQEIAEYIQ